MAMNKGKKAPFNKKKHPAMEIEVEIEMGKKKPAKKKDPACKKPVKKA